MVGPSYSDPGQSGADDGPAILPSYFNTYFRQVRCPPTVNYPFPPPPPEEEKPHIESAKIKRMQRLQSKPLPPTRFRRREDDTASMTKITPIASLAHTTTTDESKTTTMSASSSQESTSASSQASTSLTTPKSSTSSTSHETKLTERVPYLSY